VIDNDIEGKEDDNNSQEEEEEIQDACGCGSMVHSTNSNLSGNEKSKTTSQDLKDSDGEGG